MSVEKERMSLTLTKYYVDRLNRLVETGLYMERQDAIRHVLSLLYEYHGIPLTLSEAEG